MPLIAVKRVLLVSIFPPVVLQSNGLKANLLTQGINNFTPENLHTVPVGHSFICCF